MVKRIVIFLCVLCTMALVILLLSPVARPLFKMDDPYIPFTMPVLTPPFDSVQHRMDSLGYDPQKDSMILMLLSTKPKHFYRHDLRPMFQEMQYDIYWDSVMLGIVHHYYMEFKQKDSWDYGGMYKNGSLLMLTSSQFIPQHRVSDATYEKLRQFCLKQKKFY